MRVAGPQLVSSPASSSSSSLDSLDNGDRASMIEVSSAHSAARVSTVNMSVTLSACAGRLPTYHGQAQTGGACEHSSQASAASPPSGQRKDSQHGKPCCWGWCLAKTG